MGALDFLNLHPQLTQNPRWGGVAGGGQGNGGAGKEGLLVGKGAVLAGAGGWNEGSAVHRAVKECDGDVSQGSCAAWRGAAHRPASRTVRRVGMASGVTGGAQ
eukprot:366239-Chlamydomonas_euryale.AAC.7